MEGPKSRCLFPGHPGGSQLNATVRLREPSQFAPTPPFYELAELASAATIETDRSATIGQATLPRTGSYIVWRWPARNPSMARSTSTRGGIRLPLRLPEVGSESSVRSHLREVGAHGGEVALHQLAVVEPAARIAV